MNAELGLFVVYGRPRDYPEGFVVRRWTAAAGVEARPDLVATYHPSLAAARASVPLGLYRLERQTGDDPSIVEVWL